MIPTDRFWQIQLEDSTERLPYCIKNECSVYIHIITMKYLNLVIVGLSLPRAR